ncbi:glycoside hydrolase family 15 protein [Burkholderia sp. Ac-20344]|uniref:glycoside hydrolase family 15 protein n=1 Tax=Burkholderia sp. Ac-20344 TaxID=2703890 RepID=UPI00197C4F6A|nr:glycoside hydrolase family 15 protein [Burkholderia sp. Ac-20344]MBN3835039.1 amylase [Burkholderia sp. Ac-20344]
MRFDNLLRSATAIAVATLPLIASATTSGEAFGNPGVTATRAPAQKSFLGTAVNANASRVYFTGYRGIVSEVYYPVLDTPDSVDLQFLVGDRAGTYIDEEKRQTYTAAQSDPHTMSWRVTTGNAAHNWRIVKTVFTDPSRNALIERVTFQALNGTRLSDHNLYLLFKPSLDNSGMGNSAYTATAGNGKTMLIANRNTRYSALATSLPWKKQDGVAMVSNGFVGKSDGWTDLLGGTSPDRQMNWTYSSATNGNVAQMGWLDFGTRTDTAISFDIALAFDSTSVGNAMATANGTLGDDLERLRAQYDESWHTYAAGLSTQGNAADNEYYLAAMTLKAMQDKSNGAMIAGIGTPWGETQTDANSGGYHLVWSRDLFKFANALITAGDTATPTSVVNYLFKTLQQKADCGVAEYNAPGCPQGYSRIGRFPQNAWVSGWQYWQGTQMDEQAMPILLAWRLGAAVYNPLWSNIRLTADYLAAKGPWTFQDRWEENSGYSPSTIAAEVAGLVAAAQIARDNGDPIRAGNYLATADYWQQNLTAWTYTNTGSYGNGHYYVRINPANMSGTGSGPQVYNPASYPDSGQVFTIGNGGGVHDERAVVDGGFLELVRMGVKRANDPTIVATLGAYDSVVKQTIDGQRPAWFRYNFDGYGEHNDGSNYDGTGVGRLWPIFTAERGMYSIASSGSGAAGSPYLNAIRSFATREGFIPEQIWPNSTALPGNWQVVTPSSYTAGTPTKSMAPLNWAMGEYISLLASTQAGKVVDIPSAVCARYSNCVIPPPAGQVAVAINVTASTQPGQYMYVTGNGDALGNWNTNLGLPVDPSRYPVWSNTVNLRGNTPILYKYYRKNGDGSVTWENLPGSRNRMLTTPASGAVTLNDKVNW